MTRLPPPLPDKLVEQMRKAGLPLNGGEPFRPRLARNRKGDLIIEKADVAVGPKAGKRGWVDEQGRIWVRDRAHANAPDHWDVQIDGGQRYIRIDDNGAVLP